MPPTSLYKFHKYLPTKNTCVYVKNLKIHFKQCHLDLCFLLVHLISVSIYNKTYTQIATHFLSLNNVPFSLLTQPTCTPTAHIYTKICIYISICLLSVWDLLGLVFTFLCQSGFVQIYIQFLYVFVGASVDDCVIHFELFFWVFIKWGLIEVVEFC